MKNQTTQFYIARHGETQWNCLRRLQGNLDSPLTSQGIKQASLIAETMSDLKIDSIYSSPIGRAFSTATICQEKLSLNLIVSDELVERDFGDWQGQYFDDLSDQVFFENIFKQVTEHSPPNGESGVDCRARVHKGLVKIANNHINKNILIISHGDAIRCFLSSLSNKDSCDAYSQYGNGSIFAVKFCHQMQQFQLSS